MTHSRLSIRVHKNTDKTSKVPALNETCFMCGIFSTEEENEKQCVIIRDEVCEKKCCYMMG